MEGTLTKRTEEFNKIHNELRYRTYAEVTGKPLTEELKREYEALYAQYGSNSAVFRSLGCASDFYQKRYNQLDPRKLYKPIDGVSSTLEKLAQLVPISIFTNLTRDAAMRTLDVIKIKPEWFTHMLVGDDIKERKPALDGFYRMIELSALPPLEILYVGDRVDVDIVPASKVGIKTGLMWGSSDKADYSFEKFEDLVKLF